MWIRGGDTELCLREDYRAKGQKGHIVTNSFFLIEKGMIIKRNVTNDNKVFVYVSHCAKRSLDSGPLCG